MPALSLDRNPQPPSMAAPLEGRRFDIRIPSWVTGASAALPLLALLLLASQWREPDLNRLQIEGRFERVAPEAVRQAAVRRLSGGFFSTDVDSVRTAVAALPWVARARVERVWPTGLRVRVWEREAFARWNADSLLDTAAAVFTPAAGDLPASLDALPRLSGTAGNESLVAQTYRRLSTALDSTMFAVAALHLDPRGEWTARTRGGIELRLGQGRPEDKLPIIVEALPAALGDRIGEVDYVDLRYTNGFAIGWLGRDKRPATEGRVGTPPQGPVPPAAVDRAGAKHG